MKYFTIGKNVQTMDTTSTVEDTSKHITNVKDTFKLITVTTDEDTFKPVTTSEDISKPVATVKDAPKPVPGLTQTPFALCTSFWEQQTNALLNMWTFQKWANLTGFRVLEPFAYQSTLGLTDRLLHHYDLTNVLHFSDYFDLNLWTNMTKKNHGIPPFEEWNAFVLSPLKRIVVVILLYESPPIGEFIDNDITKHRYCKQQKENFYGKHAKIFDKLQIKVVRNHSKIKVILRSATDAVK